MTNFQEKVLNLSKLNYCVSEIAHILCCNISSVSSACKALNITCKKFHVNTVKHDYFDNIDSDIKAYLLGFFVADGNLYIDKNSFSFHISILEKDSNVIYGYKNELNMDNKILFRQCENRQPQVSIKWHSKHMGDIFINKYFIKPNKTMDFNFKFPFELIPEMYYGSFIRGFIDGDGCFESHEYVFTPTLVSTSKDFLLQISDIIFKYTEMTHRLYTHQGKTCVYYSLRLSCNRKNKLEKVTKLYHFLYDNSTIYLERKYQKIINYLEYRANH